MGAVCVMGGGTASLPLIHLPWVDGVNVRQREPGVNCILQDEILTPCTVLTNAWCSRSTHMDHQIGTYQGRCSQWHRPVCRDQLILFQKQIPGSFRTFWENETRNNEYWSRGFTAMTEFTTEINIASWGRRLPSSILTIITIAQLVWGTHFITKTLNTYPGQTPGWHSPYIFILSISRFIQVSLCVSLPSQQCCGVTLRGLDQSGQFHRFVPLTPTYFEWRF